MASDYRGKNRFHFGFRYAWKGLKVAILTERNVKIHLLAMIMVIIIGLITKLSTVEWAILFLTIGAVISMEIINTALERALDYLEPKKTYRHRYRKRSCCSSCFSYGNHCIIIACLIFFAKMVSNFSIVLSKLEIIRKGK